MKRKAVVAMSGGVDSSVAAALLKERGYEVVGVTLRLFDEVKGSPACCGAAEAGAKARAVCDALGVRHYLKDATRVFSKKVIDAFVGGYAAGATPNPCVDCNRFVKFEYLSGLAGASGADFLATGHYARTEEGPGGFNLLRGVDPLKDQSYFLYCLKREQLPRVLFPLGGLAKKEVREKARRLGLPTAGEKESSDICFVGAGGYGRYLKTSGGLKARPGRVVDAAGRTLGRHDGFYNFTVGQRRGLGVHGGERLYVTGVDAEANEVTLGRLEEASFAAFSAAGLNWLAEPPPAGARLHAQIRYRHMPAPCLVTASRGDSLSAVFDEPQFAPARGQSVVFYEGDRVLGGGVISEVK